MRIDLGMGFTIRPVMINSPVADYVNNFVKGIHRLVPSMDEMIKLFSNRFEINQVLFAVGFTVLGSYYNANYFQYWTSNEDQETQGVTVDIYNGTRVMMIKLPARQSNSKILELENQ